MEGREPCSIPACVRRWFRDEADEHIQHLKEIGGGWVAAPDTAEMDPQLLAFTDSWLARRLIEQVFREAQDSGSMRRFRPRKGALYPLHFLVSAHRLPASETDLVEFRFGAHTVPVRLLLQTQWVVLDQVRGGLPHDRTMDEVLESSRTGPDLIEGWRGQMDQVLAADEFRRARELVQLHGAVKLLAPGTDRNDALKELRSRWQALGEEIGLIPRIRGGRRLLIADETIGDLYEAGVRLAQMARDYDASPDLDGLAAYESDPPEGVEPWAKLLHVGAVFAIQEMQILLDALPDPKPGHPYPGVGVHVVRVLSGRLSVPARWIANKLDLGSVKPYLNTG